MKLICGDCFEELKNIEEVDITFTSPPYNRIRNDKYENYDDTVDEYYEFLKEAVELCLAKTRKYVILNIQATHYNRQDVYKLIGHYADKIQNIVIWEKSNPLPASGYSLTNAYEFFLIIGDEPIKSNYTYTKNHITTAVNSETTTKIHKAVMKQEVADWFIMNFTKEGDVVLDCFMGLGTTGISCKKFGRDFVGIEKNEEYFHIAEERLKYVKPILF